MRPQKSSLKYFIAILICLTSTIAFSQNNGVIKAIKVRGNKRVSEASILSAMRLKSGQILSLGALDEDVERIKTAGWFSAVRPLTNLLSDNTWEITIDVKEFGVVREVAVQGNTAIDTETILKAVSFNPKKDATEEELRPFNLNEIASTTRAIRSLYDAKGFFGLVEGIAPSPSDPTSIIVSIREQKVNSITIEGFTNTKKRVFDQLIKTKPGQIYSLRTWERDNLRMVNTQWFEGMGNPVTTQSPDGGLDLLIKLNDARTGMFNAGVVLDPQNSLAGTLSYSESNLWGTGQSVAFNYTQATLGLGGSVSFDYSNPFIDRRDTTLRASIYDRVQFRFANNINLGANQSPVDNQYAERRTGGSLATTRPISEKKSVGFSGRFERVGLPNLGQINNNNFIQQSGEVAGIALTSIYNTRDLDIDPARGRFLRLDVEPGYTVIDPVDKNGTSPEGRFSFFRAAFDFRTYSTRDKRMRTTQDSSREVHAFRLRGGTIQGTIPFFEQFFAGGNDSVRGYFEQRFWGNNTIVATYEFRKPIQDQFSLVAFVDYGGAWGGYGSLNDFTQTAGAQFRLGYGFGIRLRTPIGPVRLDYAFNGEGGSRPHFMIGTNF